MRERRGPWYLITGLILGAVLGLAYAWIAQPVQYTNTSPASLRADFKDQYRALIAAAFAANRDLVRARARLVLLKDADTYRTLAEQAQRTLAGGSSLEEARALGMLAVALGQAGASTAPAQTGASPLPQTTAVTTTVEFTATTTSTVQSGVFASTTLTATLVSTIPVTGAAPTPTGSPASTPRVSATPALSPTPLPTRTPSPTPGAPYVLEDQQQVCNPELAFPLIQVEALDAAGNGVPGVEVIVTWEGGENHFFTGLKPELGLGYADFEMATEVSYNLRLAEGGQPVSDLKVTECQASGETLSGGWKLVFIQP